jgi:hypothetical protein
MTIGGIVKSTVQTGAAKVTFDIIGSVVPAILYLRVYHNCNPRPYVLILAALPLQINSFCVAIAIKITLQFYGLIQYIMNYLSPELYRLINKERT